MIRESNTQKCTCPKILLPVHVMSSRKGISNASATGTASALATVESEVMYWIKPIYLENLVVVLDNEFNIK